MKQLLLACVFMVLEYCLIQDRFDTNLAYRVLERDPSIICRNEISFKTPESVVSSTRGKVLMCITVKMEDFNILLGCDPTSLTNRFGLAAGWLMVPHQSGVECRYLVSKVVS